MEKFDAIEKTTGTHYSAKLDGGYIYVDGHSYDVVTFNRFFTAAKLRTNRDVVLGKVERSRDIKVGERFEFLTGEKSYVKLGRKNDYDVLSDTSTISRCKIVFVPYEGEGC